MHVEPVASPSPAARVAATQTATLPPRGLALLRFGLQQPLLGLRVIAVDPELRRIALRPIAFLATICLLVALASDTVVDAIALFFTTMLSLAPLPVVLFGRTYRRLAAVARVPLGLTPRDAARPSLGSSIGDAIRQTLLLAIGLAPVYLVVELLSGWRPVDAVLIATAWVLGLLWTLHWISIEALDNAQTLAPGTTQADVRAAIAAAPDPWFVRLYTGPLRPFGGLLRRLARPWRRKLAILARYPELVLGFGLGVAVLLLIPLGALVFRPAAVVGGAHLLGRLEDAEQAAVTAGSRRCCTCRCRWPRSGGPWPDSAPAPAWR